MKKIFLLLLLSLFAGKCLYSQQFSIGFSGGVGTWRMNELKSLNETVQPNFDAKLVTDFPARFYYQPSLLMKMDKVTLGLNYTYQSTGSRISAKDYSGEYRFDMLVHSNNVGVYAAMDVVTLKNSRLSVYVKPGLSFSNLEIKQYLILLNTVLDDQSVSFKALNYYLEPGMEYSWSVFPSFSIEVNLGYYLQAGKQDFYTDGDKDRELTNPVSGESVKPNWTGIRFGLTLVYTINPKAGQPETIESAR
jgi:hypothetical protein